MLKILPVPLTARMAAAHSSGPLKSRCAKVMESMNESSFVSAEAKIYRLNLAYRLYHFAVGAATLVGAAMVYHFLILSVVLALFGVFMVSRPLVMAVTGDQYSITFTSVFSENSLQRSLITAVETKNTGKGNILILWRDIDKKERLAIPDLFAFDDDWHNLLSTHRGLSDDKPLNLFEACSPPRA
jgi:hypothetical protein